MSRLNKGIAIKLARQPERLVRLSDLGFNLPHLTTWVGRVLLSPEMWSAILTIVFIFSTSHCPSMILCYPKTLQKFRPPNPSFTHAPCQYFRSSPLIKLQRYHAMHHSWCLACIIYNKVSFITVQQVVLKAKADRAQGWDGSPAKHILFRFFSHILTME